MKKWDWVIIFGIGLAALLAFGVNLPAAKPRSQLTAEVYVDGKLYRQDKLPAETAEWLIEVPGGYNLLLLLPDGVEMLDADCAGNDCVHTAKITRPGQIIACLPHRVVVQLRGAPDDQAEVDAVAG